MVGGQHPLAKYGRAVEDVDLEYAEFIGIARTKYDVRSGVVKAQVLERYDWGCKESFRSNCGHGMEVMKLADLKVQYH